MFPAIFIQCEWQEYYIYKHWNIYLISSWGSFTFLSNEKGYSVQDSLQIIETNSFCTSRTGKISQYFQECLLKWLSEFISGSVFTPLNSHFLLIITHWFLMAQMSAESKFQNHVYENKCEAHIIKHLLKKLLVQLSTRGTETMAVLPTTIKHLTLTSKYKLVVMGQYFLTVLMLIVYLWKSNTDCS